MKEFINKAMQFCKTNRPHILTGVGLVSMIGGTVWAVIQTKKTYEVDISTANKVNLISCMDGDEKTKKKEIAKVKWHKACEYGKLYLAPAALVVGGTACVIGGHIDLNNRFVGTAEALAGTTAAFAAYRGRVADEYGKEKEEELYFDAKKSKPKEGDDPDLIKVRPKNPNKFGDGHPYMVCFNEESTLWQDSANINLLTIKAVLASCERQLRTNGKLCYADVLKKFGYSLNTGRYTKEQLEMFYNTGWTNCNEKDCKGDGYIRCWIASVKGLPHVDIRNMESGDVSDKCMWLEFNVEGSIWK